MNELKSALKFIYLIILSYDSILLRAEYATYLGT